MDKGMTGKRTLGVWEHVGRKREPRTQVGSCAWRDEKQGQAAPRGSMGHGKPEGGAKSDSPDRSGSQRPRSSGRGPIYQAQGRWWETQTRDSLSKQWAGSGTMSIRRKGVWGDHCQQLGTCTPCPTGWVGSGVRTWQPEEEQRQDRCHECDKPAVAVPRPIIFISAQGDIFGNKETGPLLPSENFLWLGCIAFLPPCTSKVEVLLGCHEIWT